MSNRATMRQTTDRTPRTWHGSAILFADAFGCPVSVAQLAVNDPTPLLRAIIALGHGRVRWAKLDERPRRPQGGAALAPCWLLGGAPADHDAICAAADEP